MHFCTYFDINYIHKGLALYRSLERQHEPFALWILCLDDRTEQILRRLALPHAKLISLEDFERDDAELLAAKKTRSAVEYYWTCSPSLPLYVFRHHPEVEVLTYIDSDIAAFGSSRVLLDELGEGSVLMTPHDCDAESERIAGRYNVGVLVFRSDANGIETLRWWRQKCNEWCYHRSEDGKWGDQAYLNEWPERFRGIVVSQHKGLRAAPWNAYKYTFTKGADGQALIDGAPLAFYHFHGISFVNRWFVLLYSCLFDLPGVCGPDLYAPYIAELRRVEKQLAEMGEVVPIPRRGSALRFLAGRVLQRQKLRNFMVGKSHIRV